MKYLGTILMGLLFVAANVSLAQPDRGDRFQGPAYDRIESYKKVRMLEALKLDEEHSVKFVTRYSKHQQTMRDYEKERNELVDRLDTLSRNDAGDATYDETFNGLLDIDKKIASERQSFLTEMQEILSNRQIAQYIVFERNFGRELRQAIRDVQRDRLRDR